MGELLDPEGVWDFALVELMFGVALELEARETEKMFGAMYCAAGSLFSKKPMEEMQAQLETSRKAAKAMHLAARGSSPLAAAPTQRGDASQMLKVLGAMGLKAKAKRPASKKGNDTSGTRIHGGK